MRKISTLLIVFVFSILFASEGEVVDNGDGTFTYTQTVNADSPAPYYTKPDGSGFGVYAYYNEDYGWQHDFPEYSSEGLNITSAKLTISAWDVDSEPKWGTEGEYDGIAVDGNDLKPGLLQGSNNTVSETVFDVPIAYITDDGLMDTYLDIDMNHDYRKWATRLTYSELVIDYTFDLENDPPFVPEIAPQKETPVSADEDLVIEVTGPEPPDNNGDPVTYRYRWFVDVGQGFKVDDEFAGKNDHKTNRVPASQIEVGETWSVDVTAEDSKGVVSSTVSYDFPTVTNDKDGDGVEDDEDDYPEDASKAFDSYYPAQDSVNTLFFEDTWPGMGDYDFNDMVAEFNYKFISNSSNSVVEMVLTMDLKAKGAGDHNGIALKLDDISSDLIASAEVTINGESASISPESGNGDDTVFILEQDTGKYMPEDYPYAFYNTEDGDDRPAIPLKLKVVFTQQTIFKVMGMSGLNVEDAPFDIFIFKTHERGREIHLRNMKPTAKVDTDLFGTGDDNSDGGNIWYVTNSNLPWAVEVSGSVAHPLEKNDFIFAYPEVSQWATSNGVQNRSWYLSPRSEKIWKRK